MRGCPPVGSADPNILTLAPKNLKNMNGPRCLIEICGSEKS